MRKVFCLVVVVLFLISGTSTVHSQPATDEAALSAVSSTATATGSVSQLALSDTGAPGMITFNFRDADIRNVLRLIAVKSNVNIVYGPDVTGVVNMELKDVPWEQALGLVLDINGYAYQREGNVIKVLRKEALAAEPLATEVFALNYAKAENVAKSIEQILGDRGRIKTDERSNTLIITDIPSNLNRLESVLKRLDARTSQVLIETRIIQFDNRQEKNLGIKWTSLKEYAIGATGIKRTHQDSRLRGREIEDEYTYEFSDETEITKTFDPLTGEIITYEGENILTNILGRDLTDTISRSIEKTDVRTAVLSLADFNVVLSALENLTDTHLLSNPKILTADNETAQIKVVDEYPIPNYTFDTGTSAFTISGFDYKDIGITFDVTPNISSDGYITMKIEPQVSSLVSTVPFAAGGSTVYIPLINLKKVSAKVVIKSGDTLAVGGLIDEDKTKGVTKIPLLGDIPILGRLFRHDGTKNNQKNIVFFITATIIDEETREMILHEPDVISEGPKKTRIEAHLIDEPPVVLDPARREYTTRHTGSTAGRRR